MTANKAPNNVVWHHAAVNRPDRERQNGHRAAVVWFTGLSGAGKSTLAHALEEELFRLGCRTFVFDGDNVRHGLCADLGFSEQDRHENIRRIAEMSKLFVEAGVIALNAFISPLRADRQAVRRLIGDADFIEIYVKCPLAVCESRDVKGMYKKARAGLIKEFTGISSPYEEPEHPEMVVDTSCETVETSVADILSLLRSRGVIMPQCE